MIEPGLVALLATLLGSTAFDSFSASAFWQSKSVSGLVQTLTLAGFCVVVALLFQAASRATGGVSAEERAALPGRLAHSLVPIVVGYVFAHYLTYLVEKGQAVFYALFDPFGRRTHDRLHLVADHHARQGRCRFLPRITVTDHFAVA